MMLSLKEDQQTNKLTWR